MSEFSDSDALALVNKVVELAKSTATDDKGKLPVSICCIVVRRTDMLAVPTVLRRMDGAKAPSVPSATNKAITVLIQETDTYNLNMRQDDGSWSDADAILQTTNVPQYMPWRGGIQIFDKSNKTLVCSLGIAGRTSLGDHKLAVLAAHKMGYMTNFNENGLPSTSDPT